jgi:7-carboxy-7-deazaguanine synthase
MDTVTAEVKVKRHPVIELFGPVIQGEGSQAGVQTLFIRFGGCDYRCAKCDSLHAVIPGAVQKNAEWLTPLEIADRCTAIRDTTGVEWITFSGGNPLMHRLDELVSILTTRDFQINVETQGTLWQDWLYAVTIVTVSPKSLGMGEKFEEGKYRRFLERLNGTRWRVTGSMVVQRLSPITSHSGILILLLSTKRR